MCALTHVHLAQAEKAACLQLAGAGAASLVAKREELHRLQQSLAAQRAQLQGLQTARAERGAQQARHPSPEHKTLCAAPCTLGACVTPGPARCRQALGRCRQRACLPACCCLSHRQAEDQCASCMDTDSQTRRARLQAAAAERAALAQRRQAAAFLIQRMWRRHKRRKAAAAKGGSTALQHCSWGCWLHVCDSPYKRFAPRTPPPWMNLPSSAHHHQGQQQVSHQASTPLLITQSCVQLPERRAPRGPRARPAARALQAVPQAKASRHLSRPLVPHQSQGLVQRRSQGLRPSLGSQQRLPLLGRPDQPAGAGRLDSGVP